MQLQPPLLTGESRERSPGSTGVSAEMMEHGFSDLRSSHSESGMGPQLSVELIIRIYSNRSNSGRIPSNSVTSIMVRFAKYYIECKSNADLKGCLAWIFWSHGEASLIF